MIVVDTHAWYWWLALPERLSRRARAALVRAQSIVVSPLSCYEVAVLVGRGRIELDRPIHDWLRQAMAAEGTVVAELHPAAALAAAELGPAFPGDPIDRIIYATAVDLDARLVTNDQRLRDADPERTLW